ncbi:MAG: ThuA domain-containing protein [Schlesneria sp.]
MRFLSLLVFHISLTCVWASSSSSLFANDPAARISIPKRILLLGQRPDTHPKTTHEYMAGIRLIARFLNEFGNYQVVIEQADNPWSDGPELLDGADAAVVFLTEGAKWVSEEKERLAAFQRLASRSGGLCVLHWGMGTREAEPIADFVSLFGGCHGGPDRKYKVDDFQLVPSLTPHPILSGITPFNVHDELYYALKFPGMRRGHTVLLNAKIAEANQPVAWAWQRDDSGRSFGFTGLHFHENWNRIEYRRLVVQGILWTLKETIPTEGLRLDLAETDLELPEADRVKESK